MRSLLCLSFAVVVFISAAAEAKTVSFPADNFSIEVPAEFGSIPLPPMPANCRSISAGRNTSNGHLYNVLLYDGKLDGAPQAFLTGMQTGLTKSGKSWTASQIRDETIKGTPFSVFTVSRETGPPFMLVATAFTKEHVYSIQVGLPTGNVEDAPDLKSIVQSFQFLQPVRTFGRNEQIRSSAYRLGYVLAAIGSIAVLVLLVRRVF
jgi:hypothetical protein